jgi:hypothetical protein
MWMTLASDEVPEKFRDELASKVKELTAKMTPQGNCGGNVWRVVFGKTFQLAKYRLSLSPSDFATIYNLNPVWQFWFGNHRRSCAQQSLQRSEQQHSRRKFPSRL